MVRGPLRTVLWVLGTLGIMWVILWMLAFPSMGNMMDGTGMMGGGMGGDGMMGGGWRMAMTGAMVVQALGMLGLAGIFVYLVVDTVGGRSESESGSSPEKV